MEYVEAFNFRVQITKDVKHVKKNECEKNLRNNKVLIFADFSWPFLFSLTSANRNLKSRAVEKLPRQIKPLKDRMTYILWFHFRLIFDAYRLFLFIFVKNKYEV